MPSISFFISGGCVNPQPPAQATAFIDGTAINIPAETEAEITGACDSTLTQGAIPLAQSYQEAGFEVYVGGRLVPKSMMVGKIEVDTQLERQLNTWVFLTAVTTPAGVFGSPFDRVGPPTGLLDVDLYACYKVNGQVVRWPLMLHGVATLSKRIADLSRGTRVGWYEQLEGLDRGGRFDGMPGTLVIPPGANLRRDQVVEALIGSAFDASSTPDLFFNFEAGNPVNKEVQLIDGDPWQLGQEMFALEGRRLLRDPQGFNWNPRLGLYRNPDAVPVFTIDERLILSVQTFEMDGPPGKIPTSVTLTGTEQLTSDPAAPAARKVVPQQQEVFESYLPNQAWFEQDLACALTALSVGGAPSLIRTKLIVTTLEYLGPTLVAQTVETYAYVQPEAARYAWDETTHAAVCQPGVFLPFGAVSGDQAGAWASPTEQWLLQSRVRSQFFYDAVGYQGPIGLPTDRWYQGLSGTAGGINPGSGFFLGSITTTEEYYMRRHAYKAAAGATPWQSIDPIDGVLLRGSGEAVADAAAQFVVTKKVVDVQRADTAGTLVSTEDFSYSFGLYMGADFQYQVNNGQVSSQPEETFELTGLSTTVYVPISEGAGFQQVQTAYSFDGSATSPLGDPVIQTGPGAPPTVAQLPKLTPDPTLFPGGQNADPNQTQPIKVEITMPALLATHPPYKVKVNMPWAEGMQELADAGLFIIEQAAAAHCTFTTPLLGMVYAGDWITLRERPFGIDGLGQVVEAKHWTNGTPSDPFLSTFVVAMYPIVGGVEVPEIGTTD